jgi:hypothetical protein
MKIMLRNHKNLMSYLLIYRIINISILAIIN